MKTASSTASAFDSYLVTPEDFGRGYKDCPIVLRTGATDTLRLVVPTSFEALQVYQQTISGRNAAKELLLLCVPSPEGQATLNRTDVDSLCELVGVATALTWGTEKQREFLAAGGRLLAQISSTPIKPESGRPPWRTRAAVRIRQFFGRGRCSRPASAPPA